MKCCVTFWIHNKFDIVLLSFAFNVLNIAWCVWMSVCEIENVFVMKRERKIVDLKMNDPFNGC